MNDSLNDTVAETLDERSQAYSPPDIAVDLLLARARREQGVRRAGAVAGAMAAAAAVVLVVAPHLGTPKASQSIPAGPASSATSTTEIGRAHV